MHARRSVAIVSLVAALICPAMGAQTVRLRQDGHTLHLENAWARYEIDVAKGARIVKLFWKPTRHAWVYGGANAGLFIDHLWQQHHPGELQNAPYEYRLLSRSDQEVVLQFSRSIRSQRDPNISLVVVERTMTFRADSPAVRAVVRLINPTGQYKRPGFWQQHCFYPGGDKLDVFHFRPSTIGIKVATNARVGAAWQRRGEEFVKDPVAGWTGTTDTRTREGAVFLMDYNYLRWLYNCTPCWTSEFFLDRVSIAPGRHWETETVFVPTQGYTGFSHADRHVIAHVHAQGDKLVVDVGSVVRAGRDCVLTVRAVPYPDGPALVSKEVAVPTLGFQPTRFTWGLPDLQRRAVLVKTTVTHPKWASRFETFLAPGQSPFEVVSTRVAYRMARPPKAKRYDFPPKSPPLPKALSVLLLKGMHVDAYRIEEAVARVKGSTVKKSYYTSNVYGNRMDYVPASAEELFRYNLVVVGNVDYEAIGSDLSAYLRYFVDNGGTVLVLGGLYAFGHGQYKGTPFEQLLPVASGTTFDLVRSPKPLVLAPSPGESRLAGLAWSDRPSVQWRHVPASLKKGATVLVRAGSKPFLVEHKIGRGRVLAVLGAPLGTWTQPPPFWQWKDWPKLVMALADTRR